MSQQPDSRLDQQLLAFRSRLVAQAWDLRDRLEDELAMTETELAEPLTSQPEGLIPRAWRSSMRGLGGVFCVLRAAPVLRHRSRKSTTQLVAKGSETVDPEDDLTPAVKIIEVDVTRKVGSNDSTSARED